MSSMLEMSRAIKFESTNFIRSMGRTHRLIKVSRFCGRLASGLLIMQLGAVGIPAMRFPYGRTVTDNLGRRRRLADKGSCGRVKQDHL